MAPVAPGPSGRRAWIYCSHNILVNLRATGNREQVRRSAARHVLQTFFNNSMESAVAAMLGVADKPPSSEELTRLARLIERARRFEAVVEAHGGDLMVDDLNSTEPDDPISSCPPESRGKRCATTSSELRPLRRGWKVIPSPAP